MFMKKHFRVVLTLLAVTLAFGAGTLSAQHQQQGGSQPNQVVKIKLPLELPAIGNIDAVKNWRFGRIEQVVQEGADADVTIHIRTEQNQVLKVIGPRVLRELARESNWYYPDESNSRISREDYVERMIAFDVDDTSRIIAMVSLEPLDRDRSRLRRALCK